MSASNRRRGLKCAKCGRTFRKGQAVQVLNFGRYEGVTEYGPAVESWLAVVTCNAHEADEVRQAVLSFKRRTSGMVAGSEPPPNPPVEPALHLANPRSTT